VLVLEFCLVIFHIDSKNTIYNGTNLENVVTQRKSLYT